jgi:hypothetical protein
VLLLQRRWRLLAAGIAMCTLAVGVLVTVSSFEVYGIANYRLHEDAFAEITTRSPGELYDPAHRLPRRLTAVTELSDFNWTAVTDERQGLDIYVPIWTPGPSGGGGYAHFTRPPPPGLTVDLWGDDARLLHDLGGGWWLVGERLT